MCIILQRTSLVGMPCQVKTFEWLQMHSYTIDAASMWQESSCWARQLLKPGKACRELLKQLSPDWCPGEQPKSSHARAPCHGCQTSLPAPQPLILHIYLSCSHTFRLPV